jgi:hypothetical protein
MKSECEMGAYAGMQAGTDELVSRGVCLRRAASLGEPVERIFVRLLVGGEAGASGRLDTVQGGEIGAALGSWRQSAGASVGVSVLSEERSGSLLGCSLMMGA